jgi:hypothetical protein
LKIIRQGVKDIEELAGKMYGKKSHIPDSMKAPSGIEGIAVILLCPTTRGIFPLSVLTSTRFVGNLSQELSRPLLLQKKNTKLLHIGIFKY